jgi:hypothetical protein
MIGLLNVASLILGVIALGLPIVSLFQEKKEGKKKRKMLSFISFSACTTAIYFQLFYSYFLVNIGDWTALMDIMGTQVFVAGTLLIVTIILNIISFLVFHANFK